MDYNQQVSMDSNQVEEQIRKAGRLIEKCRKEIGRRIIGQQDMINGILMGIVGDGHVLLEGVPGLAKTLAVQTMADVLDLDFKRIQFTPDLLPADIIGTTVYRQLTDEFTPRKGPVFSNIILADEINRAPAKVQSALLEAMAEKQVTIGTKTHPLPSPFFVMATQNPIEQEGTYLLPEAELDRFMLKLTVDYPTPDEEIEILRIGKHAADINVEKIMQPEMLQALKKLTGKIVIDEKIERYIVTIVSASRQKDQSACPFARYIEYGASPRASIYLAHCARIQALFNGQAYVTPDDVKAVAPMVLRHRILLSYEAESEQLGADDLVKMVLTAVAVP